MKKLLPDIIAILAFVVISFVYFFPADIEGRILFQHDSAAGAGAGRDAQEYFERTGERSRWTNSIFGGMPTYQMAPSYDSTKSLSWVEKTYQLYLPDYVVLTFIMMLGFYILLRAFGISAWLAGFGGIIWAFSSYFFILIPAGHIWKFVTLAYIPPTIAGVVLAYRKKYLLGGIITALFIALQIRSNHIQMSYYFMFVILFIIGAYFEEAYKKKELTHFFKASAILALAAMVGVCINLSNLYHTYEYSKETMRGKSELKQEGNAANQTSSGLDRDYITNWSYGIGETLTLLVPNVKGGASSDNLSQSEAAMEKANLTVEDLNLMDQDKVPEDADAIMILAPLSDFSTDDAQKVKDYMAAGGKAIVVTTYTDQDMTNFKSILDEYGVSVTKGILAETDNGHYYQNPFYLIPEVKSNTYTSDFADSKYVFAPYAQGLTVSENDALSVTQMLVTSENAVVKDDPQNMTSYESEDGDETGQFTLGAKVEKTADDTTSTLFVFSSENLFTDESSQMVGGSNLQLFTRVINDLSEEQSSVSIPVKKYTQESITVPQNQFVFLGLTTVILLPVLLLTAGIVIWVRRRRR